jgi:hypothetical protein
MLPTIAHEKADTHWRAMESSRVFNSEGDSIGWSPMNNRDPFGLIDILSDDKEMEVARKQDCTEPLSVEAEVLPYEETLIYGEDLKDRTYDMDREAINVMKQTFASCCDKIEMQHEATVDQVAEAVKEHSNYRIMSITRTKNRRREKMHGHFKQCYNIDNECVTFHGTGFESALSIPKTGFRGAVSNRAQFGRGIYSSPDVWTALAYAEPFVDSYAQSLLMVKLLQGPTIEGSVNKTDFGTNEKGEQILSLSNSDGKILCASYDDQLLPTHRIIVQYMFERKPSVKQILNVRILHHKVKERLHSQSGGKPATSVQQQISASSVSTAATSVRQQQPVTGLMPVPQVGKGGLFPIHLGIPIPKSQPKIARTLLRCPKGFKEKDTVEFRKILTYYGKCITEQLLGADGVIEAIAFSGHGPCYYISITKQIAFRDRLLELVKSKNQDNPNLRKLGADNIDKYWVCCREINFRLSPNGS